jgi:hypothetical protein
MQYKYVGKVDTIIYGIGIIRPGQIVETEKVINNPLFQVVRNKKRSK